MVVRRDYKYKSCNNYLSNLFIKTHILNIKIICIIFVFQYNFTWRKALNRTTDSSKEMAGSETSKNARTTQVRAYCVGVV